MAVNAIYGHDTMMTDELFHGYELAAFNLNGKCTMETIFSRIFGNFREFSGIFGKNGRIGVIGEQQQCIYYSYLVVLWQHVDLRVRRQFGLGLRLFIEFLLLFSSGAAAFGGISCAAGR